MHSAGEALPTKLRREMAAITKLMHVFGYLHSANYAANIRPQKSTVNTPRRAAGRLTVPSIVPYYLGLTLHQSLLLCNSE